MECTCNLTLIKYACEAHLAVEHSLSKTSVQHTENSHTENSQLKKQPFESARLQKGSAIHQPLWKCH